MNKISLTTKDKTFVKCPVEEDSTGGLGGVWLSPDETVDWSYYFSNGEKKCYGYKIIKKLESKRARINE